MLGYLPPVVVAAHLGRRGLLAPEFPVDLPVRPIDLTRELMLDGDGAAFPDDLAYFESGDSQQVGY